MKRNIRGLIVVFLVFYLLINLLRDILKLGLSEFIEEMARFEMLVLNITGICAFFIPTLVIYLSFFYFMKKQKWIYFFLSVVFGFFLFIGIRYGVEQILVDRIWGFTNYRREVDLSFYVRDNIYFFILYGLAGLMFFLFSYTKHKEKREMQLVNQNQEMQLSLLRSQINPHFLLNSMNNIYSLVFLKSDKSLVAIDKLSEILKYTLYESKERVPLSEEINYLNNYITLQNMRFENEAEIKMEVDPNAEQIEIPTFLLVPLIENAFKHGELHEKSNPLHIQIKKDSSETLSILIKNKKKQQQKDELGGIGLENVRQRLSLLYADEHSINIQDTEFDFFIEIKIPAK